MPRLMAVSATVPQVEARTKTVTRRVGWQFLHPGAQLVLVDRNPRTGQPYRRLATVEVVSVARVPLWLIDERDVAREGFPAWHPETFIRWYAKQFDIDRHDPVTRIEWTYLHDWLQPTQPPEV